VCLIIADLLVGIKVVEERVLVVVIAFTTMGGEISFNPGPLITHLGLYVSGVVGLVVVLVPLSMTISNQTHMEIPVAQVMTIAQMSLRTGLFPIFFFFYTRKLTIDILSPRGGSEMY